MDTQTLSMQDFSDLFVALVHLDRIAATKDALKSRLTAAIERDPEHNAYRGRFALVPNAPRTRVRRHAARGAYAALRSSNPAAFREVARFNRPAVGLRTTFKGDEWARYAATIDTSASIPAVPESLGPDDAVRLQDELNRLGRLHTATKERIADMIGSAFFADPITAPKKVEHPLAPGWSITLRPGIGTFDLDLLERRYPALYAQLVVEGEYTTTPRQSHVLRRVAQNTGENVEPDDYTDE